eukprot:10688692-Lingulodinium_polyedra.AAC.1
MSFPDWPGRWRQWRFLLADYEHSRQSQHAMEDILRALARFLDIVAQSVYLAEWHGRRLGLFPGSERER